MDGPGARRRARRRTRAGRNRHAVPGRLADGERDAGPAGCGDSRGDREPDRHTDRDGDGDALGDPLTDRVGDPVADAVGSLIRGCDADPDGHRHPLTQSSRPDDQEDP
jgi:hypothetical protein